MPQNENNTNCYYDYANKCDCSEDDKCGCDFPNNMPHDYSINCFTEAPVVTETLTIGMTAPDFTTSAILYDNTIIEHFNFYKYTNNKTTLLLFYPEIFTTTCPSELLAFNEELPSFAKLNTRILGITTDSIYSHLAWKNITAKNNSTDITFPLIADKDKTITARYGFLSKKGTPLHATVIIDRDKIIRNISLYDNALWRTPEEYLRLLNSINSMMPTKDYCPTKHQENFIQNDQTTPSPASYLHLPDA